MKTELISEIMLFSLIPLISVIVGGVAGINFKLNGKVRSLILHLAAGVIFAVVAIELLPDIVHEANILGITIGFFAGLLVMMLIKYQGHKAELKHKAAIESGSVNVNAGLIPWGMLMGIAIDIFIDGILMGVGFAAGASEGTLLAIALSLEILVLGLVVATELKAEKVPSRKSFMVIILLAVAFFIGALLGAIMLSLVSEVVITYILAFGLSALMYLVTEELLVEAHESTDTPLNTATFFVGFFIFLLLSLS